MAKAQLVTAEGTKVTVEGAPDEVAALVAKLAAGKPSQSKREASKHRHKSRAKVGPVSLISDLIGGGFFKKPKELSAVKLALEEQGHFYPATSLSPILLRLVRRRSLRRIKDNGRWQYVG